MSHERGVLRRFLGWCQPGSPVAIKVLGNWYWIVDEIEGARFVPRLMHPRSANGAPISYLYSSGKTG
jgi:hypothetical protein